MVPVFAQTNSTSSDVETATKISGSGITVTTDKNEYNNGDTISITGSIEGYESGKTLSLIVRSPIDNVVVANEINVDNDGVFFHTIHTGSDAWDFEGVFVLSFIYDSDTTQYTIRFVESFVPVPTDRNEEIENKIQERNYINIQTDKPNYEKGDIVTINGKVNHYHSSTPLTIMIISPNNSIVYIDQLDVSRFKEFSTSFIADGSIKLPGTYKIEALYGTGFVGKTTFDFGGIIEEPEEPVINIPKSGFLMVEDFRIDYMITEGSLELIEPNMGLTSLDVAINTELSGELLLSIPRGLLDYDDASGFLVIDGSKNLRFEEVETTQFARTIIIDYEPDTRFINIIGTHVVPEFGTVVFMIFAVAIVTVIGLTYNNKLKIP